MWTRSGVMVAMMAATLMATSAAVMADERSELREAQQLAWNKQFEQAEAAYRQILQRRPHDREAELGLARVVLWRGRYREARTRFLRLGDREGAATAAYWQGDFRTAAREFHAIRESSFARESIAAIAAASRPADRIDAGLVHDDQPFTAVRSSATSSFFSDPLTRWDVTAGSNWLSAPRFDRRRSTPFATIANETVFPWQRLTIATFAGAQRFPDGSSRPVGGIAARWRATSASTVSLSADHREILTNATGLGTHPSVTRSLASWTRFADQSWLAGIEAGSLRYFDHNRGRYAQGYALVPVQRYFFIGGSAAVRNTEDDRFYIDAVSGSRAAAGDFVYGYRGSYTPYWTPRHLREVRAIAMIHAKAGRIAWKAQLESGISRDVVKGFGPPSGPSPLPANFYSFDFKRRSHPARAAISFDLPIANSFRLECSIERNITSFYAANSLHASLVRHR